MKTVSLAIILKNEEHVIERCLKPFLPHLDYWVLADNGSTDKSEEVAKGILHHIPGEYLHHKWHDFSTNRNMCLEEAEKHADYVLMMDADDRFVISDPNWKDQLDEDKDFYWVEIQLDGIRYLRPHVLKSSSKLRYHGVLHEYVEWQGKDGGTLKGVHINASREGARNKDPEKYLNDAKVLLKEVEKNPEDTRSHFYLAQSYRDAEQHEQALEWYLKRAVMGGWSEEICASFCEAGKLMEKLDMSEQAIIQTYLNGHYADLRKAEPLLLLSNYYGKRDRHDLAFAYASEASLRDSTEGLLLFIDKDAYNYKSLFLMGVAGFYSNGFSRGYNACLEALEKAPESEKELVRNNIDHYRRVITMNS